MQKKLLFWQFKFSSQNWSLGLFQLWILCERRYSYNSELYRSVTKIQYLYNLQGCHSNQCHRALTLINFLVPKSRKTWKSRKSQKSRKSCILQFLDQKVLKWQWLIFTLFGALDQFGKKELLCFIFYTKIAA